MKSNTPPQTQDGNVEDIEMDRCLIMTTDLDARGRWIWNARESAGFGLARRRWIWNFVVRLEGRSEVEADPKSRFEFVVQDKSRQFVVWMCLWALDMDAHRGA
ncbi:hypothetical protein LguiA_020135 [Lonicera macranthoides]